MKVLLMVAYGLVPVVFGLVYFWWLPNRRERDLERRLSRIRDPHEAGILVDAALADAKREAQIRREMMGRDIRFL